MATLNYYFSTTYQLYNLKVIAYKKITDTALNMKVLRLQCYIRMGKKYILYCIAYVW